METPDFDRCGLYKLPFRNPDGSRPCVAVTAEGVRVGTFHKPRGCSDARARSILTEMLNAHDDTGQTTRGHLQLLKGAESDES